MTIWGTLVGAEMVQQWPRTVKKNKAKLSDSGISNCGMINCRSQSPIIVPLCVHVEIWQVWPNLTKWDVMTLTSVNWSFTINNSLHLHQYNVSHVTVTKHHYTWTKICLIFRNTKNNLVPQKSVASSRLHVPKLHASLLQYHAPS